MTDVLMDVLWTEKFRPKSLEDLALAPDTLRVLQAYVAAGEIPHLFLVGPPGSGKTTVARILYNSLDCQHLVLNASAERGIDVVRDKIANFAASMFVSRFNIIHLDECDALTADAQTALRNLIETYAERTRFILTANAGHKVLAALQSRCQVFVLGRPPLKERHRVLAAVLKAEGIEAAPMTVLRYAEKYADMRRLLWAAQKAVLSAADGVLPLPSMVEAVAGQDILAMVLARDWAGVRKLAASADFDPVEGLRSLFWAIPDEHKAVGMLRHIVGRGVHEQGFTPDPVVLFLAVVSEAMEGLKK